MSVQHYAAELAISEGYEYAAAGLHAVPQRVGEPIGERLIERNGEADIAESGAELGPGHRVDGLIGRGISGHVAGSFY